MNRIATKTALFSAVALSAAFVAQTANAALITEWDYEVNSTFISFSETGGAGSVTGSNPNPALGGNTVLSWGGQAGDQPSSVSIDSVVNPPPPLVTNDPDGVRGATFRHDNNVIPANSSILDRFRLMTELNLTASSPATGAMPELAPIEFASFFTETFNEPDIADCVGGSQSACDDIFVLSNGPVAPQGQSFTLDGFQYTVFLQIDDLTELTDAQCAAAGANTGCVGFLTQEDQNNAFGTRFSITADQLDVPEPGSIALLGLGLGLLGVGYARRRNSRDA